MKKAILLFVAAVFALTVTEKAAAKDVVYLNNGNVVSGKIIETKTSGDIVIETEHGTLTYTKLEFYKIEQGTEPKVKKQRRYVAFEDRTKRAYFFAAELSGGSTIFPSRQTGFRGLIDKPIQPVQFSVVNGIRFSEFFQLGVGVGVRYYIGNRRSGARLPDCPWAFPLYADLRGNFISHQGRNLVPYWSLDAGYTFSDDNFYFSPTIGISIGGKRNNVLVGLYYMGQVHRGVLRDLDRDRVFTEMLNGLGLKVGFQF